MPRIRNNIQEAKADLSYYFQELSHGIRDTSMKFNGVDELISFAVLDILTSMFHSKPAINQERFIANLESILDGIKRYLSEEKSHDSAKKKT